MIILRKNKVCNFSKQLIKRFILARIIVFCIKYFRLIIYTNNCYREEMIHELDNFGFGISKKR